jgi:hypothetical protein
MTCLSPRAGLAQLVERQLPKLNVASSNLVPRSILRPLAGSRQISGDRQ